MTVETNRRSSGRRFQFRLRSLFVLVTTAAFMLAAVGYFHQRLSQQWQAIDEVDRAVAAESERLDRINDCDSYPHPGVGVTTRSTQWLGWDLARLNNRYVDVTHLTVIGEVPAELVAREMDRFPKLVSLRLESPSLQDRDLDGLSRLANLEEFDVRSDVLDGSFLSRLPPGARLAKLSLRSERLDDATLRSACQFSSLTSLDMMGLRLENGATLLKLGELPGLESLSLSGQFSLHETTVFEMLPQLHSLHLSPGDPGIDGATFSRLCRCEAISDLQLFDLKLTQPESLREMSRLQKLFSLDLHGDFPNEGLDALATIPELDSVALDSPTLNNDGVRRVAQSPTIFHLTITSQNVDDSALDDLAAMPSLRMLTLWDTRTTTQGIARLRSKRPDIDVSHQPRH